MDSPTVFCVFTTKEMEKFLKITSIFMIISFIFPLSASAEGQLLGTKTVGKLTMVAILLVTAAIVKMLVDRDRKEVTRLHERLGPPDGSIEFQEGFDLWRVEWYRSRVYIFRNGVLYRQYLGSSESLRGFDSAGEEDDSYIFSAFTLCSDDNSVFSERPADSGSQRVKGCRPRSVSVYP